MKDATAAKAKNTAQKIDDARPAARESIALHHCYGKIGISAVAAAVRYQGSAKNPAYAPARRD
jgi:hypothetical protein